MADVFTREQRSIIMGKVKSHGNEATEIKLLKLFRAFGIKRWRRHARVFGKPDFVFPTERVALFVDGCFWHSCPVHGTIPATNETFWRNKLDRNRRRDRVVKRTLTASGWRVVRIWQHDLRDSERLIGRIQRILAALSF